MDSQKVSLRYDEKKKDDITASFWSTSDTKDFMEKHGWNYTKLDDFLKETKHTRRLLNFR